MPREAVGVIEKRRHASSSATHQGLSCGSQTFALVHAYPRVTLIVTGTAGDECQGWEECFGMRGTVPGACGTFPTAREILLAAAGTPRELGAILLEWLQTLL